MTMIDPNQFMAGTVDLSGALNSIAGSIDKIGAVNKQREAEDKQKQLIAGLQQAASGGDMSAVADYLIQNPNISSDVANNAYKAMGIKDNIQKTQLKTDLLTLAANPDNTEQILTDRISKINERGGNPEHTMRELEAYRQDPQGFTEQVKRTATVMYPQEMKQLTSNNQTTSQRDWESMTSGLSPADREKANRIRLGLEPRAVGSASQTISERGTVEDVAQTESQLAASKEAGKLSAQLKLKPEVESAVKSAVSTAVAIADQAGEQKSNEKAWDVYSSAMSVLNESLGGTETGPFVGMSPAFTSSQQIADGAVASMAPVLKQLFRSAGEGSFSDTDQKLLMDMVPTRKDTPEARRAKIQNIDAVVRSKLGIGSQSQSQPEPEPQQSQDSGDFSSLWGE